MNGLLCKKLLKNSDIGLENRVDLRGVGNSPENLRIKNNIILKILFLCSRSNKLANKNID